ncbi:hypothetical protein WMF45_05660 [Sorangium sp. So ce448]
MAGALLALWAAEFVKGVESFGLGSQASSPMDVTINSKGKF